MTPGRKVWGLFFTTMKKYLFNIHLDSAGWDLYDLYINVLDRIPVVHNKFPAMNTQHHFIRAGVQTLFKLVQSSVPEDANYEFMNMSFTYKESELTLTHKINTGPETHTFSTSLGSYPNQEAARFAITLYLLRNYGKFTSSIKEFETATLSNFLPKYDQ